MNYRFNLPSLNPFVHTFYLKILIAIFVFRKISGIGHPIQNTRYDFNSGNKTPDSVLWLKIPEQTEPPFRSKLNQMLKDGFANQI